ncbi:hypothetical protein AQUCO_00300019v1 [Aquilegia coerulea]|uniref:Uncharacterized protein n=1 Tax=Aquilegia coerulea TaxID=218851 RepID=A0A2G5EWX4_AQUCA|nr:hypothetical protein AQUCO_00300019v1 [Aquilegia coerulea]
MIPPCLMQAIKAPSTFWPPIFVNSCSILLISILFGDHRNSSIVVVWKRSKHSYTVCYQVSSRKLLEHLY